jgi:predicted SnoaL-like aldol condensation-catalyzing enzyme
VPTNTKIQFSLRVAKFNRPALIAAYLQADIPSPWRAAAPIEDDMTATSAEQNKALVLKAFDTLFNKCDYEAAANFWSDQYIQHSSHIEPGRDGLFNLVRALPDTLRYEHAVVVAEGDYVILHGRFSGNGQPSALIAADIVRVETADIPWSLVCVGDLALANAACDVGDFLCCKRYPDCTRQDGANIAALLHCRKTPTNTARLEKQLPAAVHKEPGRSRSAGQRLQATGPTSPGRRNIGDSQH